MTPSACGIDWGAVALQRELAADLPGVRVQIQALLDSTNTRLLELCRTFDSALFEPVLLVAEAQTAGRGRLGRSWHSASGASLTFSLALPLQCADLSGLSLAVGVALAEALDAATAPRLLLKWPNDLWLCGAPGGAQPVGRKLGGVLIETVSCGARRIGVIGVGLNVLPLAVPDPSSGVACLQELHPHIDAAQALRRVALPLARALRLFEREGFAGFEARYAARDVLFGRDVVAGALQGVAQGVAANGALRLRSGEGPQAQWHDVASGEVSVRLLRAPPADPSRSGHAAFAPPTPC